MSNLARLRKRYLDLMEDCLLGRIHEDPPQDEWSGDRFDARLRAEGRDWPSLAQSMIGERRMHNVRQLCEDVIARDIPGDFVETGVWRGGSCIMMRSVLKAYEITDRTVWCADSFEGLPPPDPRYAHDAGDGHSKFEALAISVEEVAENFRKYALMDGQVRFLKGWFKDTLPTAPIERLAVLRLDGDMYQSTMDAFQALYDKLSPGGFCVVDDMGAVPACRRAVEDFRTERGIADTLYQIDWTGYFWRKGEAAG